MVVARVREGDRWHRALEVEDVQRLRGVRATADTEPAHVGERVLGVRDQVLGEFTVGDQ